MLLFSSHKFLCVFFWCLLISRGITETGFKNLSVFALLLVFVKWVEIYRIFFKKSETCRGLAATNIGRRSALWTTRYGKGKKRIVGYCCYAVATIEHLPGSLTSIKRRFSCAAEGLD
jgi:hypothetical protein